MMGSRVSSVIREEVYGVPKYRLKEYVSVEKGDPRVPNQVDTMDYPYCTLEDAVEVACKEIFLVSILEGDEYDKYIAGDVINDYGKFWGDYREYGIAIYEKSGMFRLSWRRHGKGNMNPKERVSVDADSSLKDFGVCRGFVHSHGGISKPSSLNDGSFKFSDNEIYAKHENSISPKVIPVNWAVGTLSAKQKDKIEWVLNSSEGPSR
ncbi:MAG: hypothetical protein LBB74_05150 [Chitinispirillales bacterium]|jgi:hypothetical protein|nr:hypothetical protein [Chitinispirillales bacterium]